MTTRITLWRELFSEQPRILLENDDFTVTAFRYASGVEGLKIQNSRGHLVILPWMGQMIWDAQFDGHDLTMRNMFRQPKPAAEVVATYGCFAFHSGLLANGCPSPEDTHPLHGEMPCAAMDDAWLELEGDSLRVTGRYEYVMGFGHHYQAQPAVVMRKASALFDIQMTVTNLASVTMPLQYMCHMNYAYVPNATFRQNIPDTALKLRESVPAHVKPTAQWLAFNQRLLQGEASLETLNEPGFYDPEIVFFADELDRYTDTPEFSMIAPDGTTFVTRFASAELNYVTRWILYNGDQQVAAFALPATCRPEGFLAAQRNGTLLQLEPQQTRTFTVTLIDDHLIVRSGFAQLLGLEPDLQVVAEFGSGREALAGLPGRGVQVCICDISMPDISGLELLSQLPKGMATIMLSVHDSPALVEQALNAGARGFLSKRCSPDELIAAVHTVATGGCYLTPDIAVKLAAGRQDPLTKRERQVAEKLAQGMAVKEIAAELGLSPKTVHVHRANLLEKLGVSNDVELAHRMFDGW
ncbi:transcriptional regulator UhpA [Salmonella enterica subsp. enterica serovar Infantis]|nr:transcriptional regulator UhpA [Salmonella enterica subsp. enterica serovar Infantis]